MVGMQIIRQLDGEDITGVAVGASHACAWSSGGECYFPPLSRPSQRAAPRWQYLGRQPVVKLRGG